MISEDLFKVCIKFLILVSIPSQFSISLSLNLSLLNLDVIIFLRDFMLIFYNEFSVYHFSTLDLFHVVLLLFKQELYSDLLTILNGNVQLL